MLTRAAYDPFLLMQDQGKLYGFTLSLYEYQATIPTLWDHVKGEAPRVPFTPVGPCSLRRVEFIDMHPEYIAPDNAMKFISDNDGQEYNRCHCRSCSFYRWGAGLTTACSLVQL